MDYTNSLASVTKDMKEAISIIADHMIKIRPRSDVSYRPYRKSDVYYDRAVQGCRRVNLKNLYPDAKPGNVAYVGTVLNSATDYNATLHFIGNVKAIYEGKVIYDYTDNPQENGHGHCPVSLKKGENLVLFMVRCDNEEKFEFEFMPSEPRFRMWAKDYIINIRATSPIGFFAGEDGVGISKLYEKEEDFDGEYVYPVIGEKESRISFDKIYPDADGVCAYALTYALADTKLDITAFSQLKITVNGQEVSEVQPEVKKGDAILIKCQKGEKWGFSFDENAPIGIPFLISSRTHGDKWLTVGTFGKGNCMEITFEPEKDIQFNRPYITEGWDRTFWKLDSCKDYIRPYISSCFFSQWFYAVMVGHFGLLQSGKILDEPKYMNYFTDSMQNMAKFFDYMQFEHQEFDETTFMPRSIALINLDSIGTIGMNMCELYKLNSSSEALNCIEVLAKAAKENIPRFEDGTYCRPTNMWADDTFMSCPFLVRAGLVKKDKAYFEEIVRQLLGYKKRLWMEDKKIFSHIFYLDTQVPNRVPWGRGNGWVFVTLSDVLENMPEDTPGREQIMELYKEFAEGISARQDEDGLWHQVLTRPDSYQETSCTGMFIIGMCRGVRNGWLGEEYKEKIQKAYNALLSKKIDKTGNVYDVCMGSGNSMDEEYYVNLGAIDNDDHGTGIVLTAIAEMVKIFD